MATVFDYEHGFVAYPQERSDSTGAKAPTLDLGADRIPASRYYSREDADLEWEHMWTKTWNWVGVTHDLAKPGDFFRAEIGKESFVVVRSEDGKIRAFYNVCPHRANWITNAEYGSIPAGGAFYCNFHGWRFNTDGSVREVKDRELFRPQTLCGLHKLAEARVEVWNSLVFLNMDPNAMPLEQYLDVIPRHLAYANFGRMKVYSELMGTIDANWKTAIEAFIEFYHADNVHPQALPITATKKTQYDLYSNGMSRMIIPIGRNGDRSSDPDEVTDILRGFAVAFWGDDPQLYEGLKGQEYQKAHASALRKWAVRNGHADLFEKNDGRAGHR